jgi:ribonuclease R
MSKNKKQKKEGKKSLVNKKSLTQQILGVLSTEEGKSFNYRQLAKHLGCNDTQGRLLIVEILDELAFSGQLEELQRGKFKAKPSGAYITGIVDMTSAGYAFIVSADTEEDVFVSQKNLHQALHGDKVKVMVFSRRRKGGQRSEGEVVEIIDRSRRTFVGIVEISKNYAFLLPDNRQMPHDLFIPLKALNGAKNGQKAIGRITEWPPHMKNPIAEIVQVLGDPGNNDVEMHAILAEFELPYHFDKAVEEAAEALPGEISPAEYKKRRDFREVFTITIDPADAKDFDDALSIRRLNEGRWEIGVHIADVTHYVKPGSILEHEAFARANSVYLVDRVVPMLPERLSNFICSLRPHEDKLCFSAVFEVDEEAQVHSTWFGRTIIHSNQRFAYEEAQEIIETGKGEHVTEVLVLHQLAQKIRAKRFKSGSIAFERDEVKFEIDEAGKPLRVYYKVNKESNQLIEEFMLLANKKVAEYCSGLFRLNDDEGRKPKNPFVFRIHDKPDLEKLETFGRFITRFGHSIQTNSAKAITSSLNQLLEKVRGSKEQNLIETLALRSMAKAVYSTSNIGHYGLAFKHYAHFTSPIRRYPDMMVHRLLQDYLDGVTVSPAEDWELKCKHSSDMEKRASDAERASIKYKQVEFMSDKIGQVFDGIISGVADFGIFVEISSNKCEGLVSMRELSDDFYEFDEDEYQVKGRRTGKSYQLGDNVRVEVVRANLPRKQLDFRFATED